MLLLSASVSFTGMSAAAARCSLGDTNMVHRLDLLLTLHPYHTENGPRGWCPSYILDRSQCLVGYINQDSWSNVLP